MLRTVLDPATPLFREARYLLEEEADVRDTALYHSLLAAVAAGNASRGGIASYIGRRSADIGHHLNVLEDCGLLRREPDVFRAGRSSYRIAGDLLAERGYDVRDTVLACYSGVGFHSRLVVVG